MLKMKRIKRGLIPDPAFYEKETRGGNYYISNKWKKNQKKNQNILYT